MSKRLAHIGVVATATTVSRLLGLGRDALVAGVFGTTLWNSAFQFAFMLPNLFRRLLAEGQLTAALVPTLAESQVAGGRPAVFALLNKVATWLFLATLGLTLLAVAVLAAWASRPDLAERFALGARLAQVLFPYLIFVCLAAALSAVLQLFERFSIPALTAVWLNVAMIAGLGLGGGFLAETPQGKLGWLCAGVLVGGALQVAVPWVALRRDGWKPVWDSRPDAQVWSMLRLMAPGLIGTAIYQVNFLVSRSLAFSLDESAVSVLTLANRIMEVPQGIFTVSVATVVFPLISGYAARGELSALAAAYASGVRLVLAITVPGAVGLWLLREPIVRLIFERGAFSATDTAITAPILGIFAVGLPFYGVVTLAVRGCFALKDTVTPVRVSAVAFLVNLGASLWWMRTHGTAGLAWASNLAIVVQTLLLQRALAGKVEGLGFVRLVPSLIKIAIGTAVMGAAVVGGWRWLGQAGLAPMMSAAVAVGGLIPLAVGVYGAALWLLRIEGRDQLHELVRRGWGKLTGGRGAGAGGPEGER
jgi:putative peptidoglycan lipid II flippase